MARSPAASSPATRRPGISIRPESALSATERAQLERAGLEPLVPQIEGWCVEGSNRQNAYATHGLFRYFGKFPPPIASLLISRFTQPGDLVWDPMCGSGTTGVEALLSDRQAHLVDVNPVSLLVARVKTRHCASERVSAAFARVEKSYQPAGPADGDLAPPGLRNPDHWFLPATARALRGLQRAISREPPHEPSTDVLWLAFVSIVRRVSRATTQQGRLFLDAATAIEDPWPLFQRRILRAQQAIAALPDRSSVRVERGDARVPCSPAHLGSAKLVILHPPYFNAYRYSRINCLELAWLGELASGVRPLEIREFFKVGDPKQVQHYVADMRLALSNAATLLAPSARLGLMMGDTIIRGEYVPATRLLLETVGEMGLVIENLAIRTPRHSEASWVASQRRTGRRLGAPLRDYVVVLRRANA